MTANPPGSEGKSYGYLEGSQNRIWRKFTEFLVRVRQKQMCLMGSKLAFSCFFARILAQQFIFPLHLFLKALGLTEGLWKMLQNWNISFLQCHHGLFLNVNSWLASSYFLNSFYCIVIYLKIWCEKLRLWYPPSSNSQKENKNFRYCSHSFIYYHPNEDYHWFWGLN